MTATGHEDWGPGTVYQDWKSDGEIINPSANEFLAVTGLIPPGFYDVVLWLSGPGAAVGVFQFIVRSTPGGVNLYSQIFRTRVDLSESVTIPGPLKIEENCVFWILARSAMTGTVQAAIIYRRVN